MLVFKCTGLGCGLLAHACGSQFVGGDGCVWVNVCTLYVQYVYHYAKKGALTGFELECIAFSPQKKSQDYLTLPVS